MTPQERLVSRMLTVYGEPKADDPTAYINEFEKAIRGWSSEILELAGDEVIRKSKFWPRPAEIIEVAYSVAAKIEAKNPKPVFVEPDLPPPTPEQVAAARELISRATEFIRAQIDADKPKLPAVDKPAFEAMQKRSRSGLLVDHAALTRRMTGERD